MPSVFFKIDSTDLTSYVDIQSYAVNREDVFEEWDDGNWITHREIARTRYVGTFRLGFSSSTAFSSFMTLIGTAKKAGGYYSVTAYINNLGTTAAFDAYLDMVNEEDRWDPINSRQWQVTTVQLTGR